MVKALIVNSTNPYCGVYQYGKRLYDCLFDCNVVDYSYAEADKFEACINTKEFDFVVFNWHQATMLWADQSLVDALNNIGIKSIFIYHDCEPPKFNNCKVVNSDYTKENGITRPIISPIFYTDPKKKRNRSIPHIGSFGLGVPRKRFDLVCKKVVEQFDEAVVNLHICPAKVVDPAGNFVRQIVESCEDVVKNTKIKLNITSELISDMELAKFLWEQDINIFMYDDADSDGLSSVVDHAVGVCSVFAVNGAKMFRHALAQYPEINIDKHSIEEIISLGDMPARKMKFLWSEYNLRSDFIKLFGDKVWKP